METVIVILFAMLFIVGLGYIVKLVGNAFAFIFALVMCWILVPQENRAVYFANLCDNMFNKKEVK